MKNKPNKLWIIVFKANVPFHRIYLCKTVEDAKEKARKYFPSYTSDDNFIYINELTKK